MFGCLITSLPGYPKQVPNRLKYLILCPSLDMVKREILIRLPSKFNLVLNTCLTTYSDLFQSIGSLRVTRNNSLFYKRK